jgi:DNA-directed RNA polymerase subunit K/omega
MPDHKYRSRYEKTRILSARALQISQGSPVLVKVPKGMTKPLDIARLEWEANLIPIDIKPRQVPGEKKKA